jgi:uncharacterized membrane protein
LNPDFVVLDFDNPDFAAVAGDACEDDDFEDNDFEDDEFDDDDFDDAAFDILAARPFPFFTCPLTVAIPDGRENVTEDPARMGQSAGALNGCSVSANGCRCSVSINSRQDLTYTRRRLKCPAGQHEGEQKMNLNPAVLYLGAFGIGVIAGLRSLTALAVTCWAAHWGWLDLSNSRLAFFSSTGTAVFISLLALAELVADKLPSTPNRTVPVGLVARIVTGGLSASVIFASAHQPIALGAILGALGGIAGAFAGYQLRHRLVATQRLPDLAIALAEDALAIGGGFLLVSHLF